MWQQLFGFLLIFFASTEGAKILDLGGEWTLKSEDGKFSDLKALVPGGIYTDLQDNGIIGDIYWKYVDNETRWIPRTNWTYSKVFEVDENILSYQNIFIKFEGLDTFSKVLVNDVEVGYSRNMFVQYLFNLSSVLVSGKNTIEVKFLSPIEQSENIAKQYLEGYIIPPECFPVEYQGECYVNQIRKMQASFSWDWGPSFPSVGIWKDVTIEAYNSSLIHYLVPQVIDYSPEEWLLSTQVFYSDNSLNVINGTSSAILNTNNGSLNIRTTINVQKNDFGELVNTLDLLVPKNSVDLWWPNGFGDQPLYTLNITFTGTDVSWKSIKIGFRTIELVQEPIDQSYSFYFKVNGYPIYMKGSNVVPLDILPEKGYLPEIISKTFDNAIAAHMNMLRVWGGGVYESDLFYQTADERGILIWQDYMFASAYYPVHQEFLDNVVEEVRHQTKRISGHPCIALIAGNNENEGNVKDNSGWYNQGDHDQYIQDYIKLTIDTIKPEVLRITRNGTIFVGSSPTCGILSDQKGGVADSPGDTKFGDIHMYQYGADHFDSSVYPVARFISEYGLQSFPSMDSLLTITNDTKDLEIHSSFMDNRNHHPDGNNQINDMVKRQFNVPQENSENYFHTIVHYSQVVVGWGIKIATEHYRRWRSFLTKDYDGHTMGALYWQMNDVWIAPSWAGVDYNGNWKILQYKAVEFFAPIIVTGHIYSERHLEVYGVSDLLEETIEANFILEVYLWTSFTPVSSNSTKISLAPSASQLLFEANADEYLSQFCGPIEEAKTKCLIRLALTDDNNQNLAPENFVMPSHIKEVWLETPDLKISSVTKKDDRNFDIELTTDRIAMFVWLDSHAIKGRFTENSFTMYTEKKIVGFKSEEPVDVDILKNTLTVLNIRSDEFK